MKKNEIENYIHSFPKNTQKQLQQIRKTIIKTAPQAEELISYKMPAYKYWGMLVYFAGYEKHIGFYPTSSGIRNFKTEISEYKNSVGAVQFPLDKPLPLGLITKIVKFRIKENLTNAKKNVSKK